MQPVGYVGSKHSVARQKLPTESQLSDSVPKKRAYWAYVGSAN